MTTRCRNQAAELKEKLPDLYKERDLLIGELNYFYSFRDFDKRGISQFENLYDTRSSIMIKIIDLDMQIKSICIKHTELVEKANTYFRKWQSQQKEIISQGFKIKNQ